MRKPFVATLFALALLIFAPFATFAADYSITDYRMTVDIQTDGSANVAETLTYDFDSSYNGILSSFDVRDVDGLTGLKLFVDGSVAVQLDAQEEDGMLNVRAYAPGERGVRVFRYEYTLQGLCQRYRDSARLNYKLIGAGNQVPLEKAYIEISIPEGKITNTWVHGAMTTNDAYPLASHSVAAGPARVESGRFVEVDMLFDADALAGAPLIDQDIVQDVRALEEKNETAVREAARRQARTHEILRFSLPGALLALALAFGLWLRTLSRKAGFRGAEQMGDLKSLTGINAAVAEQLKRGHISMNAVSGTLLELTQTGVLEMKRHGSGDSTIGFSVKKRPSSQLRPHQSILMDWLFGDRDEFGIDSMNVGKDKGLAEAYDKGYNAFSAQAKADVELGGYHQPKRVLRQITSGFLLALILGAALAIALFVMKQWVLGICALLLTGALCYGFIKLEHRSEKGLEVEAGLRTLIELAKNKPLTDQGLYVYLPLLASLGVLGEMGGAHHETQTDYAQDGLPYWLYYGFPGDWSRTQTGMRETHRHNHSVSSPSSGAGGSFSSGGGGGGGGHGAW